MLVIDKSFLTWVGHADIFADAHQCGYPHYPTYVGYSAIYAAHISDRHPIRIRMAIPSTLCSGIENMPEVHFIVSRGKTLNCTVLEHRAVEIFSPDNNIKKLLRVKPPA